MPRETSRGRKVADLIQRELALLIQREVKDPRIGMVTINEAKVSRDLSFSAFSNGVVEDPESYPIAKKRHTFEYLRTVRIHRFSRG